MFESTIDLRSLKSEYVGFQVCHGCVLALRLRGRERRYGRAATRCLVVLKLGV